MFQRILVSNSYFHGLLPYLQHLSDDAIRQLPATYFQGNSLIDMPFRLFHSNYISVFNELQPRIEQIDETLSGRLRRLGPHAAMENVRLPAYARRSLPTLAVDSTPPSPDPMPTQLPTEDAVTEVESFYKPMQ
jgi:hypothetical protein